MTTVSKMRLRTKENGKRKFEGIEGTGLIQPTLMRVFITTTPNSLYNNRDLIRVYQITIPLITVHRTTHPLIMGHRIIGLLRILTLVVAVDMVNTVEVMADTVLEVMAVEVILAVVTVEEIVTTEMANTSSSIFKF